MADVKENTAVVFRCADKLFAVEISNILEIRAKADITFIPCLPKFISGVINLMGDVIPVIDLRKKLGFEDTEYDERSCFIIIKTADDTAALRVDRVLTSAAYSEEDIIRLPEESSVMSGYITDEEGRHISLLEAQRLF